LGNRNSRYNGTVFIVPPLPKHPTRGMREDFAHLSATIVDAISISGCERPREIKAGAIDLSGHHLGSVRIDLAVG
jgi:hypothetical protein